MKSKLIILGCGSSMGVPRADGFWGKCKKNNKKNYRTRCSIIIIKGSNSILIDTSPDLRYQLLSNNIKNISSVLFTHEHADQTNGLFELRPFYMKYKKKIDVYGHLKTINLLKKRHDFCFKDIRGYGAIVKGHIIKKEDICCKQPLTDEKLLFTGLEYDKIINAEVTEDILINTQIPRKSIKLQENQF